MRFGVVGAGVIGQLRAQTILERPDCTLVGVVDPDRAAAERAAGGKTAVFADLPALLNQGPVDAVIISSPLPYHEDGVVAAFAAGAHVLCEKPLGNTVASCRRMLDAAKAAKRTLAVGFNHRYYPAIKFVKQVVSEGRIGAVDHVRVFGGHDGLHNFRADWQYRAPASGGGAMMDVGIHMTDLTRFILGDVASVYGIASNRVWNVAGSEDNAVAVMRRADGVAAFYQATWSEWRGYGFFLDVYGSEGMVRGYYAPMFNMLITNSGGRRRREFKFYPEVMLREKFKSWTSTALQSFREELADFLKLAAGDTSAHIATGAAGFRATEIAHAVYQSTIDGQPVVLATDLG